MPRVVMIAIGVAVAGLLSYAVLRPDLPSVRGGDRDDCRGAAADSTRRCSPAPPRRDSLARRASSRPFDARAFVDTIGVNTHLWYVDTSYGDYALVKRRLLQLGLRHIRDGLDPAHTKRFFRRVNDLAAAGIKSTLIACRVEPPGVPWTTYVKDAKRQVRSSLDALEGVNEPDLVAAGQADWPASVRACQRAIYRQAKSSTFGAPLKVPILGPSVQANNTQLGDISDRADGAAMHSYPGGRPPDDRSHYRFKWQMADARKHQFDSARVPVYATETGYHDALHTTTPHAPASERAAAIYLPRLLLDYAKAGVKRTFVYELVDERQDPTLVDVELNYGLFESDWSYKPSAIALKNTIALLDSRRGSPRQPLRYTLTNTADADGDGPRGPVKDMLLQKADGSYWLALWQDSKVRDENTRSDIVNPSTRVRVTLQRRMTFSSYRPTRSRSASKRRTARSFTVKVGDDVLLIKLNRARA